MIGTLLNHVGAVRVSRDDLKLIPTPPATDTWRPIPHAELVEVLEHELHYREMKIREEAYAVQRDGALLFGVIDLAWMETQEFVAAIGLRTANDKSMALQMAIGLKVLVCDNLAFSGDLIALRRRHTSRLDLAHEMGRAVDRYREGVARLYNDVARLKDALITEEQAKVIIFDVFDQGLMPVRFFPGVTESYFGEENGNGVITEPKARTLWRLHNAFTFHIQRMAPGPAFTANTRLGKLFGLSHPRSLHAA